MQTLCCSPKPALSKTVPNPLIYFDRKPFTSVLGVWHFVEGLFDCCFVCVVSRSFLTCLFVFGLFFESCAGVFLSSCFTSIYSRVFQAIFLKKEHHFCPVDLIRQNPAAETPLEWLWIARSEFTVPNPNQIQSRLALSCIWSTKPCCQNKEEKNQLYTCFHSRISN